VPHVRLSVRGPKMMGAAQRSLSLHESRHSPEGTSESSPGRQSWVENQNIRKVPLGTAECARAGFQPSLAGLNSFRACTQDCVLGYSQPVPAGLSWENTVVTQALKASEKPSPFFL
jgi:hypothetical protein